MRVTLSALSCRRSLSLLLVPHSTFIPQLPHRWQYSLFLRNNNAAPIRTTASQRESEATGKAYSCEGSSPSYVHMEEVEPFERYCIGGYYPARIGERFCERYKIVHKLGFGSYSTTWLARDAKTASYVAIKITVPDLGCPVESDILRHLWHLEAHEYHPGRNVLPPLLDELETRGPNGSHKCLVTAPASMNIAEARESSYKRIFQLPVARAIAAQLIQAITFLHSRGVVHGDLHEGNILLRLPKSLDGMTVDRLYERYGEPELVLAERLDGQPLDEGVPTHGIVAIWLGGPSEDVSLADSRILLIDFGESFQPDTTTRFQSHTPLILRAPEQYFAPSTPLSFPADIWALACTIFAILGQRQLFDTWFPSNNKVMEEQDTLGYPPGEWWKSWKGRGESFDDNLKRTDGAPRRTWEVRFEQSILEPRKKYGMTQIGDDEKAALFELLKSMLAFEPERRPSAQQVLESKWMTKWAKQDLERANMGRT